MEEMKIDDEKMYSIESYTKKGGKVIVTPTDHNMIIGKFDIKINKKETEVRKEIFNYKDKEGQKKFKEFSTAAKMCHPSTIDGKDAFFVGTRV